VAKLNSIGPRSFRGENPDGYLERGAIRPYEAPSVFVQYRGLAIVFAILALALTVYFIKSVLTAPPRPPPPVQSVYIDVVPKK
jgi:hypothetical protein